MENFLQRAHRLYPDKQVVGDGALAVVTSDGRVCLFPAIPMFADRDNFDKWTGLLVSHKRNHLVDLRTIRDPEPPKPKVEHVITFRHKMDTEKD